MSLLIKNVLHNKQVKDIYIEGNIIKKIGEAINIKADTEIDGSGKAAMPGFVNAHTHSSMTLLRGFADDMPLKKWLEQKIWPVEAKLTADDVYWGTKLACLEMIKGGTTFFSDMYWHFEGTYRAVEEMGLRAAISAVFFDFNKKDVREKQIIRNEGLFQQYHNCNPRIDFMLGPHSIYAASAEGLKWVQQFSEKHDLLVDIHISETEHEVDECLKLNGSRPVEYLDRLGLLNKNLLANHSLWINQKELELMAKNNVVPVYNPVSNLKLTSGMGFNYPAMKALGLKPALGTDGPSSNNNLSMFESMKFAALLQKAVWKDPSALPAEEAIQMATINGARAYRLNSGEISEGYLADIILINLELPEMTPNHYLMSNLVYSAQDSCVDTTICDGRILMLNRKVVGESDILEAAGEISRKLVRDL